MTKDHTLSTVFVEDQAIPPGQATNYYVTQANDDKALVIQQTHTGL